MADGLIEVARAWRPDVVVYPPPHVAGLLKRRASPASRRCCTASGRPGPTFKPALDRLAPVAARFGVSDLPEAEIELDLSPPSLERITQDVPGAGSSRQVLAMRYLHHNGGAASPLAAGQAAGRARGGDAGVDPGHLRPRRSPVPDHHGRGGVPRGRGRRHDGRGGASRAADPVAGSVRFVDWVPLRTLLGTCDAVVHHGGLGTMYAAFDAGIPQLAALEGPGDSAPNARIAAARRAGIARPMAGATADGVGSALRELFDDPAYARASREVADEMRDMAPPSTVIGDLTAFVTRLTTDRPVAARA